jgi:light-regulated signal transduction histidine kinase (bacteriophytochrome)
MKSFLDQLVWMRRGLDEMDAMQTAVEDSVQNAVNNALAELQHQGGYAFWFGDSCSLFCADWIRERIHNLIRQMHEAVVLFGEGGSQ